MQSYDKRLNGNAKEFVDYARDFGIFPAMDKYGFKSLESVHRLLEKYAPGEQFELYKVNAPEFTGPNAFDRFCEAIFRKFSDMESKIQTLSNENEELRRNVAYYRGKSKTILAVQSVMRYCEGV